MSIKFPGNAEISWHIARPKTWYLGSCRVLARIGKSLAQKAAKFKRRNSLRAGMERWLELGTEQLAGWNLGRDAGRVSHLLKM